jgi:hypothetical protein
MGGRGGNSGMAGSGLGVTGRSTNVEQVKAEIGGKKNKTAQKINRLLSGHEISINAADMKRIREMAPSLKLSVASGGNWRNIKPGNQKPVFRGSFVSTYVME